MGRLQFRKVSGERKSTFSNSAIQSKIMIGTSGFSRVAYRNMGIFISRMILPGGAWTKQSCFQTLGRRLLHPVKNTGYTVVPVMIG